MDHDCIGDPCKVCGGMLVPKHLVPAILAMFKSDGTWYCTDPTLSPFVTLEPRDVTPDAIVEGK